jgi:flagellar protein FliO/FliZ
MSSAWLSISLLVMVLALLPLGLKWFQERMVGGRLAGTGMASKVVSAVAVGPHQHVVTVEVGPADARVCLTLGVTAQSITCLHTAQVMSTPPSYATQAGDPAQVAVR